MKNIPHPRMRVNIFSPIWSGDEATVEVQAYGHRIATRCVYVDGLPDGFKQLESEVWTEYHHQCERGGAK